MTTPKIPIKIKNYLVEKFDLVTNRYPNIIKVMIAEPPTTKDYNPSSYIGWISRKGGFIFPWSIDETGDLHGPQPYPYDKFDEYNESQLTKYTIIHTFDVDELRKILFNKKRSKKTMKENKTELTMTAVTNENANVTNAPAETPAPVIAQTPTETPATPALPVGGHTVNTVADFLAMVHAKPEGLSVGKMKVSLDEVKSRLGGKINIMAVEKTANEGRNFYLVQITENSYMYSFKMMTTIISKWEDACGGIDNLNQMLAKANIVGVITDAEYNGKKYSKFDVE